MQHYLKILDIFCLPLKRIRFVKILEKGQSNIFYIELNKINKIYKYLNIF